MSQPNWKPTLILSATLFGVGLGAYWLEFKRKPETEQAEKRGRSPGGQKDSQSVTQIKLRSATGQTFEFGKSNGSWVMLAPQKLPADSLNLTDFIDRWATQEAQEVLSLKEETPEKRKELLKAYGLDDERRTTKNARVDLTLGEGKTISLSIGDEHPLGGKLFLGVEAQGKLNDESVFLVDSAWNESLNHDVFYFRDKSVVNFDRVDVTEASLEVAGKKLSLKKSDAQWSANGIALDGDLVGTWLATIAGLKAKGFPTKPQGGRVAKISVELPNAPELKRIEFTVYEKSPSLFVTRSGSAEVFELDAGIKTQLFKSVNDLRPKKLLTSDDKSRITRAVFSSENLDGNILGGAKTVTLDKGKWSQEKMVPLMDTLTSTLITAFQAKLPAGSKPKLNVQFFAGESLVHAFQFYESPKDFYGARLKDGKVEEIYQLNSSLKLALPMTKESWKF